MKTNREIADELGIKHNGNRMLCQRCGQDNWKEIGHHCTSMGVSVSGLPLGGPCPLCNTCWESLTPEQRIPFYKRLHDFNEACSDIHTIDFKQRWKEIEAVILAGG